MALAIMQDSRAGIAATPVPKVDALWRRFFAFVIDGFVLSLVQLLLSGVFGVQRVTSGSPFLPPGGGFTSFSWTWSLDPYWSAALAVAYFLVQEILFGATIGKMRMGLRVVDLSGRRATAWQIVVRNLVRPIDGLPTLYSLGALAVLFSPRHQRIGDMAAGTVVADVSSVPHAVRPLQESRRNTRALLAGLALFALFCLGFSYRGRPPLLIESWRNTGQYFFERPVASYTLGTAQWSWGQVNYPFTYHPNTGRGLCHGQMTLRWRGVFEGWILGDGSSYCEVKGRPASFHGYGGWSNK